MKPLVRLFSTHLLTVSSAATILGIGVAPSLSQLIPSKILVVIVSGILLMLIFVLFLQKDRKFIYLLLPLLLLCCGYLHGIKHLQSPESKHHIYNIIYKKTEVVLLGQLQKMPSFNGEISRALFAIHSLQQKGESQRADAGGLVQLSMRGKWPKEIQPGDMLLVRAEVKRPHSFHTPGAFDYARFLAQKDIWIHGFIRSHLFIKKLEEPGSVWEKIVFSPQRTRTRIGIFLDEHLKPQKAAAYRALLLGDRSRVGETTLELFKSSGTFHILAISGLHLSVIAILLYASLYFLLSRSERLLLFYPVKKIVAFLTIPLLIFYAMLAGMNSPVTRAVIMSSVVLVTLCIDRKKSPAALISIAALIILTKEPNVLFTVSFQLSFAAIIGILIVVPLLEKILRKDQHNKRIQSTIVKLGRYVVSLFIVSIAATIATAPFSITAFHRMSLIGPVANIFVEPLICLWTLPTGIAAMVFIKLWPGLSIFLLNLGYSGFDLALHLLTWLTRLPFSFTYLPSPPATVYLSIILIVSGGSALYYIKTWKGAGLALLLGVIALFLLVYPPQLPRTRLPRVSFIDLGQGSSTVIETEDRTILIDGGGSSFSARHVGETVIAPFLWNRAIGKIDTIIITHPDADHFNGLQFIVDHFSPDEIWLRDKEGHDSNYRTLINNARDKGIALKIGKAGDEITKGNFRLLCLANLHSINFGESRGVNASNDGLIIQACFNDYCFLFPGDINKAMEHYLLINDKQKLQSEVLLSAHHGARTSNSRDFLSAVHPDYSVVSAGNSSTGYFPHSSFLTSCRQQGIEVFTTAQDGTLEFAFHNQEMQIRRSAKFENSPLYPVQWEMVKHQEKD